MINRSNQNRRGVTLLFVISMIVLFLLMGTTFVIVSNDFLRSSRQRSRVTLNSFEGVGESRGRRFVEQAIMQVLRGPDLNNVDSVLRGHSILADMYGYGFTAFVKEIDGAFRQPGGGGAGGLGNTGNPNAANFIRLELIGIDDDDMLANDILANDILSGEPIQNSSLGNAPGRFNGQLLTFVSGGASGVSCRIIDHQVFFDGMDSRHEFVVLPLDLPPELTNQDCVSQNQSQNIIETFDSGGEQLPTRVVVNGRAFAGTGAGTFQPGLAATDRVVGLLSNNAFSPNQQGKSREELYSIEDPNSGNIIPGYLARRVSATESVPNSYSTNECYDAVGPQNMFLAAMDDEGKISAPSFWQSNLAMLNGGVDKLEYSLRPEQVHVERGNTSSPISSRSTCSAGNFPNYDSDYASRDMDVDNDGDGEDDGVWIDANLPIFTDNLGRRIKPLVSFSIVDLDSLANVNVHGNRSQIASNNRFVSQPISGFQGAGVATFGSGFGPAEIDLGIALRDESATAATSNAYADIAERLMVGFDNPDDEQFYPGRYGEAEEVIDAMFGGGPAPGRDYTGNGNSESLGADLLSAYKLFGYPFNTNDPNFSIVGGHFSSAMDIYGRFRIGYSDNNFNGLPFQTSMPVIDAARTSLAYSEIINNPYEAQFAPPPRSFTQYDQHFTLDELEGVLRDDRDISLSRQSNRLLKILNSEDVADDLLRAVTTDSYEVPTLIQEFMEIEDAAGNVTAGLQTLTTKLYHILNVSNLNVNPPTGPNAEMFLGIRGGAEPDAALLHETVVRNLTGFFPEDGNFRLDVDQLVNPAPNNLSRRALLSNDIRSGRPFDINRPFGNGLDDNSNGVVDEPNQTGEGDRLAHPDESTNGFDHDQDGVVSNNGEFGRQLFARQLYILTLLVTELVDRNGDGKLFIRDTATNNFKLDPGDFPNFNGNTDAEDDVARREYRRIVAQWAINVADFRDADSINTGFEVDLNPFDGWDVNGDMVANDIATGLDYFKTFGAERPEVLIAESIHLHDRREEDLEESDMMGAGEATATGTDRHFDSRLAPVASGFIELYHPWVTTEANNELPNQLLPAELDENQENGVDLLQITSNGAPVWRIVVANNFHNELGVFQNAGEAFSYLNDPDQRFLLDGTMSLPDSAIRRYIYFANPSHPNSEFTSAKVFAPPADESAGPDVAAVLRPGGFAVLGSAGYGNSGDSTYTTYLGRRAGVTEADLMLNQTRRIVLDAEKDTFTYYPGSDPTNGEERKLDAVLPLVSVNETDYVRSYGATDPEGGYEYSGPEGTFFARPSADGLSFVDDSMPPVPVVADFPADLNASPGEPDRSFFWPVAQDNYLEQVLRHDQLSNGVFVLLLQRLANPLRDWNRDTNPYVTIDSSGGDAFAFNGVESNQEQVDETVNLASGDRKFRFSTFERQANQVVRTAGVNPTDRNLWRPDYNGLDASVGANLPSDASHVLDFELAESFGEINASYLEPGGMAPLQQFPFSWLAWNNRPFSTALELANVPYTSSYHLTNRFNISIKTSSVDGQLNFDNNLYGTLEQGSIEQQLHSRVSPFSGEFPHLLNFHADAMQLHRLFDYVEVPSRYVGTETYVNADDFTRNGGADELLSSVSMSFAPPFDYVSNYRVPGKVNINTVTRKNVWNAIMRRDEFGDAVSVDDRVSFDQWEDSRKWEDSREGPYRYAAASRWTAVRGARSQADVGLFRRRDSTMDPPESMFDYAPRQDDLFNVSRNAYFRNLERQRLGNMVTMRSSVFAIWVTVGYFELETIQAEDESTGDMVNIEVLGAEFEDDLGRQSRNRGFFIFDRSIPVAFEPGRNHNIEKAIRVSSYIE